jgi:Sulfotransferase domain
MRLIDSLASRMGIAGSRQKCAIFVVGCQRSGTTMLLNVLGKYAECRIYNEGKNNPAYDYYRLRSNETLRHLIQKSDKPTVVFKPVLDSQHTDRLLDLYPNAKAIWMYRDYRDVINSSVKKWQGDQKDIMYGIAAGIQRDPKHHQYAISDRMSDRTVHLVRKLGNSGMSPEEGAALLWYVRNLLYFDLSLEKDPRVLLVRYEDLVTRPQQYFPRIFSFIGCHFDQKYVGDIFDTSVKKNAGPVINEQVELHCREMMQLLDHQYSVQLSQPRAPIEHDRLKEYSSTDIRNRT